MGLSRWAVPLFTSAHTHTHRGAPVYAPVYTSECVGSSDFQIIRSVDVFPSLLWFSRGANLLNLNCSC